MFKKGGCWELDTSPGCRGASWETPRYFAGSCAAVRGHGYTARGRQTYLFVRKATGAAGNVPAFNVEVWES